MTIFEDERKKRLFKRWGNVSKDLIKVLAEVDDANARAILEEIGFILLSYPAVDNFLMEYEEHLYNKKSKINLLDVYEKENKNNVVNIFEFKNKKLEEDK